MEFKISKVPKDMGRRVQQELQNALNEWRDEVFTEGSEGYLKNRRTQKIEMGE